MLEGDDAPAHPCAKTRRSSNQCPQRLGVGRSAIAIGRDLLVVAFHLEIDASGFADKALASLRIVGKDLPQVQMTHLPVMRRERRPRRPIGRPRVGDGCRVKHDRQRRPIRCARAPRFC